MGPARGALVAAAAVLAGVLLTGVLPLTGLGAGAPDLLVLVVVGVAYARGPVYGTVTGFGAGLLLDLTPPATQVAGQWTLALAVVGYLAGLAPLVLSRRNVRGRLAGLLALAGVVVGCVLVSTALASGVAALLGDPRVTWSGLVHTVPPTVLATAVLTPAVVPGLAALMRWGSR